MKRITQMLFYFLEMISGIGIGILGTKLLIPNKPTLGLNSSMVVTLLTLLAFAVIGIGIPGFFHSRLLNGNKYFGIGIGKTALGVLIGIVFGIILSTLTYSFLAYQISSYIIPILIPILFGVIGFNRGIKNQN